VNKNKSLFDLHTHSSASDGLLRPAGLVKLAGGLLAGIALTDHDTVTGLDEALDAGREIDFPVIPGIELTTDYGQSEVHVLGYFIDHRHAPLVAKLDEVARARERRAREIMARLDGLGFGLTWEEVAGRTPGPVIGRAHIVRALIAKGLVRADGWDAFFRDYLVNGAPAHVPHEEIGTVEAIRLILASGGVPVVAHPGCIGDDAIPPALFAAGAAGLEARCAKHRPDEVIHYTRMARDRGLVVTGGSDYHGEPGGVVLGQANATLNTVEELARRATNPGAQEFLAALKAV
jgi:predicted metal-dependent phosphoesterase TrpH